MTFVHEIVSHPLERTPGADSGGRDDDTTVLVDRLALPPGQPVTVPFSVVIGAGSAPSTETVHATLSWWVRAVVMPRGFNAVAPVTVQRELLVHTA